MIILKLRLDLGQEMSRVMNTRLSDEIGRHARLKIWCPLGCVGSSPTSGKSPCIYDEAHIQVPHIIPPRRFGGFFCDFDKEKNLPLEAGLLLFGSSIFQL